MDNHMNTTNFTRPASSRKMVVWYWSVRAIISILTVLGNTLVMFLIVRSRRLRVIPNTFIFALAMADFCVGAIVTPTDFACTYWYPKSCDIIALRLVFDILIHLSVTNLCALTFDRYMAVVQPLKYHSVMNRSQVVLILAITWALAAVLPVIGYICLIEKLALTVKILRVVDMVFLQISPAILLAIAYIRMVCIARQHEKTVRMQHHQLSFNYGNSLITRRRRSKQGESRERASVKMIGGVIIAFLLCYVLAIFRSLYFYIMHQDIPDTVTYVSRILLLTNSAINFLVYAFLKKDFRQELRRMCRQSRVFKDSFTFRDLLSKDSTVV